MRWRVRFRFGYLKKYDWFHRFAFGFTIGPIFFYKIDHMVYVKRLVDRDAMVMSNMNLFRLAIEDSKDELYRSIPYDFGFMLVETYSDYDIDYNRYRILVEGIPRPIKGQK